MNQKVYEFQAVIEPVPEKGGAYVRFPYDIRKEFGKGRIKVQAEFDGVPYSGSIVNMGIKNKDGSICYIIGVRKDIWEKIGKQPGDTVRVSISVPDEEENENKEETLWRCPACGRSFRHKNQEHYCGEPPRSIEEYIKRQPESTQPYLRMVNDAVREAIPDAAEKISWSMPTYWKGQNLIQFAAFRKHIGLYPGPEAVEAFAGRLCGYRTSKGTIQLPYEKPLPLDLIREIAKWCRQEYGR